MSILSEENEEFGGVIRPAFMFRLFSLKGEDEKIAENGDHKTGSHHERHTTIFLFLPLVASVDRGGYLYICLRRK